MAALDRTAVRPKDTGVALENPGMGWVFHYYDNEPANYGSKLEPSDTVDDFPGLKGRISVSAGRPIAFKLPVPAVSDPFLKNPMAP